MIVTLRNRQEIFAADHNLSRWNLQDLDDAWTLWYTFLILEARLFALYMLQNRKHQYAKSHMTFGEYWGMKAARNIIFPYNDTKTEWVSLLLNQTERKLQELEGDET
jgi:hypothetical protein